MTNTNCHYDRGQPSYPSSLGHPWKLGIEVGGLDGVETGANHDSNPSLSAPPEDRPLIQEELGTLLVARIVHLKDAGTVAADAKISAFGRFNPKLSSGGTGNEDDWMILNSKAGNVAQAIAVDSTAVTGDRAFSSTYNVTKVDLAVTAWDKCGCNEFYFMCSVVLATDVNDALAYMQYKVI